MAMQHVSSVNLQLVGDGSAATFTIPPAQFQFIGQLNQAIVNSGQTPTSAVVRNSPVAVNSAVFDGNGNLVITFASAWTNGQTAGIDVDFYYNSTTTNPPADNINV